MKSFQNGTLQSCRNPKQFSTKLHGDTRAWHWQKLRNTISYKPFRSILMPLLSVRYTHDDIYWWCPSLNILASSVHINRAKNYSIINGLGPFILLKLSLRIEVQLFSVPIAVMRWGGGVVRSQPTLCSLPFIQSIVFYTKCWPDQCVLSRAWPVIVWPFFISFQCLQLELETLWQYFWVLFQIITVSGKIWFILAFHCRPFCLTIPPPP